MVSTRACTTAIASLLFGQVFAAESPPAVLASPRAVELEIPGAPSSQLVRAVARIGMPTSLVIDGSRTARELIEARCGIVDPIYVASLLEENRTAGRSLDAAALDQTGGGPLLFPACIRIETGQYEVRNAPTVSHVYDARRMPFDAKAVDDTTLAGKSPRVRTLGSLRDVAASEDPTRIASTNRGFFASEYARLFIQENPQINPFALKAGEIIRVPLQTMSASFPVREGISVVDALAALRQVAGPSARIDQASVAELVDDVPLPAGTCEGEMNSAVWPISGRDLLEAVELNKSLRFDPDAYRPVTTLVIDTGFDRSMEGRAIPAPALGKMRSFDGRSLLAHVGINTATLENDATPPPGLGAAIHGSEVAATLIGGRFLESLRSQLMLPRLTFASVGQRDGAIAYLSVGAISTAYRRALDSGITVVNVSVAADVDREQFVGALRESRGATLLVAAAGNTKSLNQEFGGTVQGWPGSLGGAPDTVAPGLVVSVGAHGPEGELLSFSRIGKEQVDLLAPGCRIPTFSYDPTTQAIVEVERNGTSYAAPIVSLIASLLAAEGLRPVAIKDRLITSVDMDELLISKVYAGGRLNIRKALSVYRDVIQVVVRDAEGQIILAPDGRPATRWLSGVLQSGTHRVHICDLSLQQRELRKLTTSRTTDGHGFVRGWKLPAANLQGATLKAIEKCPTPLAKGVMILRTDDGAEHSIPLADVADFVARES